MAIKKKVTKKMIEEAKKLLRQLANNPHLADQYTEEEIEKLEQLIEENWK